MTNTASGNVRSPRLGVLAVVLVSYLMIVLDLSTVITGLAHLAQFDHRIQAALSGGGVMLGLSLLVALLFVIPAERAGTRAALLEC